MSAGAGTVRADRGRTGTDAGGRGGTPRLERLAWLLDSSIRVPGTRFRIGIDGLIGLLPGIGDLVGTLLSGYIVAEAARLGVPGSALARMVFNVLLETLVGTIPVAGDLFDFAWKANQRNVRLLQDYESAPRRATRRNRLVVAVIAGAVVVLLALLVWAAFQILRWLWLTATAG